VGEAGAVRATERWAVGVLLAASFLLRLWVAIPNPSASRYNDEVTGVETVERILATGSLRPAHGYYLSLSYLPQLAALWPLELAHRWGWGPGVRDAGGRLNEVGYLGARLVQVLCGVVSIWALYRLGRRAFGAATGLLAAFLLAVVPWHVRQSAIFKPDVELVLAVVLAVWAALVAVERRTVGAYALAGALIGLCGSTKFNAAAAALPLLAGTLWEFRREPGFAIRRLAAATAAALGVFVALNPYFFLDHELYQRHFFRRTMADYAWKEQRTDGSRWRIPWAALRGLTRWTFHGPLVGVVGAGAALAGYWPVRHLRRANAAGSGSVALVVLAAFPIGYLLSYALTTGLASDHNWLPLSPFVALGAAAALVLGGRRLSAPLRRVGVGVLLALAALPVLRWSYREAVPATPALARATVVRSLDGGDGRAAQSEVGLEIDTSGWSIGGPPPTQEGPLFLPPARFTATPESDLGLADALVFPAERLAGPDAGFYERLVAAPGVRSVARLAPRFLRLRGADLVVVTRPLDEVARVDGALPKGHREVRLSLPGSGPRLVSLRVGGRFRRLGEAWVEADGERHPCFVVSRRAPARSVCRTARFRVSGASDAPLVLRLDQGPVDDGGYRLFEWRG
jgi:hypothetical protein